MCVRLFVQDFLTNIIMNCNGEGYSPEVEIILLLEKVDVTILRVFDNLTSCFYSDVM